MDNNITQKQINSIIREIHATPTHTVKAASLSLNRTAIWLKGKLSREISREKSIKLRLIREKIKILRTKTARLLNCDFRGVRAADLGTPRQTRPGAVVGKHLFRGAFIAKLRKDGKLGVYRRTTKKRFPLKSERIEILEDALKIIEGLDSETENVFRKRFIHEIERITGGII